MYDKKLFTKIEKSKLSEQEKRVYKEILSEWEEIREMVSILKKKKGNRLTIGEIRKRMFKEFRVMPAFLFSFSHWFLKGTPENYIKKILESRKA